MDRLRRDAHRAGVTQADGLEIGFAVLGAVYLSLAIAMVWLLRRLTAKPPHTEVAGHVKAGAY